MDERLEKIKDRYMKREYDYALSSMDIDWLIDQAEKVQELEQAVAGWAEQYDKLVRELEQLKATNNNQLFDVDKSNSNSKYIKKALNKIWIDSNELSNVDHERGEEYISLVELQDIILEVEPE